MERRGVSHVEAVLAFVLFFGFLVFAFIFLNPFQSNRTLETTNDYAFREVSDFAQIEVETFSIMVNSAVTDNIVSLIVNSTFLPTNVSVVNQDNEVVDSMIQGNVVHFRKLSDRFFTLQYGFDEDVSVPLTGTYLENPQNFTIASSETKEVFSESKFMDLNTSYYSNYTGLKKNFNLPGRVDFGFQIIFDDGFKIEGSREISENLEVITVQDRVEVIRSTGEIEFGNLVVGVW